MDLYQKKIMKSLILSIIILVIMACDNKPVIVLKTVNFDELSQIINKNDDVLYVVNFWATWCSPCVEELPEFMEINREFYKTGNF
jgi:thiol-disulfide isomerase/thioredoxin